MRLWADSETFSDVPITHGAYKYVSSPAFEILLITYAIDDGPVHCLDLTAGDSIAEFIELVEECSELWAHNSGFDRIVFEKKGITKAAHRGKWFDTMVQALAHSLPGGLGPLCEVLQIGEDKAKKKEGNSLIHLFCKPLGKNRKLDRATRLTHPQKWERFKQYAVSDIHAMREAHRKMPKWNYPHNAELVEDWRIDQEINDRGFLIDKELAESIVTMLAREKKKLARKTNDATNGAVKSTTQRDALLEYIFNEYGVSLDGLTKAKVINALEKMDLPTEVRELLLTRQQASKASTSKYTAVLNGITDDNILRQSFQFLGAARTGRWAGRRLQVQNLPSRGLMKDKVTDEAIPLVKADVADLMHDNPMLLASSLIRKMIMARPGKKFLISDWANIEGRLVAWVAGEKWKIKAFSDFDQGIGHDLYNLAYSNAFAVDISQVGSMERAIGKVLELFLGYEGGVGAFMVGAAAYGFDMEELARNVYELLPLDTRDESADYLKWVKRQKRSTYGLSNDAFITADTLKRQWRKNHPNVVKLWKDLKENAIFCIATGEPVKFGKIKMRKSGSWFLIQLPSGRYLTYPQARVIDGKIVYRGKNQYTNQWQDIYTFGGKILENWAQAVGSDLLRFGIRNSEAAYLPVVLHVHDEIVAQVDLSTPADALQKIMLKHAPWAKGLPIAADAKETPRYKKG